MSLRMVAESGEEVLSEYSSLETWPRFSVLARTLVKNLIMVILYYFRVDLCFSFMI